MSWTKGVVVAGAALAMLFVVRPAAAQDKAPPSAKVKGTWRVVSVVADGKRVVFDKKNYRATISVFPNNTWAMTVLRKRRIRAARGAVRAAGTGYQLTVPSPAGPVSVLTLTEGKKGHAVFTWTETKPPLKGDKGGLRRAGAAERFGAKFGALTKGRTSVVFTARRIR